MKINTLKGKIIENGFNLKSFSEATKIKKTALYRKLNNQSEFDRKDINSIISVLHLTADQVIDIFFAN